MYSAFKTDDLLGTKYSATYRPLVCALALMALAIAPNLQAVNPPPDGGYPNENTAEGNNALSSLTTGANNTALGASAMQDNTTGHDNTAVGQDALVFNVSGTDNTAVGVAALANTTGNDNTACGATALIDNTTGVDNTAMGVDALALNKNGNDNTATGFQALRNNTSSDNTADGFDALASNTSGADNTASGFQALSSSTTGAENTAAGFQALVNNTTGTNNTGVGSGALANATTGASNVALGFNAGVSLAKGSNNIMIGANVTGTSTDANTIRLGKSGTQQKTFIAGIFGKTVSSGAGVIINSSGQLGTVQSSARFKEAIKPMDKASEALLKLKPVTFRYKEELDPEGIPQFGLVAEDVEKVSPDLVVRDEDGKVATVRYEAVNAMLLNEFLKEHRRTETLEAIVAQQQQQIQALTAGLEKIKANVELRSPGARTAANN